MSNRVADQAHAPMVFENRSLFEPRLRLALLAGSIFAFAAVALLVRDSGGWAALGITAVALGVVFSDLLQNAAVGFSLRARRPFRRGDEIGVSGFEGTVEAVKLQATWLRTFDGRQVRIPNAALHTSPVILLTGLRLRRDEEDVWLPPGTDPLRAKQMFEEMLPNIDGVAADPAPEVLICDFNGSSARLKASWWAGSRNAQHVLVRGRVIGGLAGLSWAKGLHLGSPVTGNDDAPASHPATRH